MPAPTNVYAQFGPPQQPPGVPMGGPDPRRAPELQRLQAEAARAAAQTPHAQQVADDQAAIVHAQRTIDETKAADVAAAHKIVPQSNVHGSAYLNTLDSGTRGVVQGLIEGRLPLPANALRTPYWQGILQHTVNAEPSFDAVNYGTRQKVRNDFMAGPDGQNLTSLGTALAHAGRAANSVTSLNNFDGLATPLNYLRTPYLNFMHDPRIGRFNEDVNALAGEKEKTFTGGNGTEGGRDSWKANLSTYAGPTSNLGVLSEDAGLIKSRMDNLRYKYQRGMGTTADIFDELPPEARAAYQRLIGDPNAGTTPFGGIHGNAGQVGGPTGGFGAIPPGDGPGGTGGSPPSMSSGPAPAPPGVPPSGPPGVSGPDQQSVATGSTKRVHDQIASAQVDAMTRASRPLSEINAYLQSRGSTPIDPQNHQKVLDYLAAHPSYNGSVSDIWEDKPTSLMERVSASPAASAVVGALNAGTAGYMDELGGGVSSLLGGDYTKTRDALNANKHALADTNPLSNLAGNIAGGIGATMLAPEALVSRGAALFGKGAPLVGDAAYGALYGSGENNDSRVGGALGGAAAGVGGGMLGRAIPKAFGSLVAPSGGSLRPLYDAGVFPSLGQRAAAAQGPVGQYAGKVLNTVEQGLQSIPLVGALPFRARNIPRDQFQLGAFNSALGDIGDQLPSGMKPGTAPHAYANDAFGKAYDDARGGMRFAPDHQYHAERQAFESSLDNGILRPDQAAQVRQVINSSVDGRLANSPTLPGQAYQAAGSDLGRAAQAWSKNPDTAAQAGALRDYTSIFDGAARRNSDPAAVQALDNADQGYAKLVRIQSASAARGGGAGTFSPAQFDRSIQNNAPGVRSSAYNRGDALMQDYGNAGKSLVDTLPNSGTYDRLAMGQLVAGGPASGAAGYALGAGAAKVGAPFFAPYLPGVNYAMTRAIAPRSSFLPPDLAAKLDAFSAQVNNRSGMLGRVGAPASTGYFLGQ